MDSRPTSAEIVAGVVARAADDVVAEFLTDRLGRAEAGFVPHPRPGDCDDAAECIALGPLLGLAGSDAGHLHRTAPHTGGGTDHVEPDRCVPLPAVAALVAARVGRDLLDADLARARSDLDNLRQALQSSRTIGVAMGVLMATCHVDRERAFALLDRASQQQNRKLRDVAAYVEYTRGVPERRATG